MFSELQSQKTIWSYPLLVFGFVPNAPRTDFAKGQAHKVSRAAVPRPVYCITTALSTVSSYLSSVNHIYEEDTLWFRAMGVRGC